MDFTTLEARVYDLVRDPTKTFITSQMVKSWINEAYLDVCARTRLPRDSVTGATSGASIALPEDKEVLEITSLRLETDDVEFVSDDIFNGWSDTGDAPDHTLARVFNNDIELYPAPAAGTAYELRFVESPPDLVAASDTPDLPTYLQWKLVHWGRYMALLKDGDTDAISHWTRYEQGLPDPPRGIVKIQPGPYVVMNAPGPFDTDEAAHL